MNKKARQRRKYLADEARRKINNEIKNTIRAIAQLQHHDIDILKKNGNVKTNDELYKLWEDINGKN